MIKRVAAVLILRIGKPQVSFHRVITFQWRKLPLAQMQSFINGLSLKIRLGQGAVNKHIIKISGRNYFCLEFFFAGNPQFSLPSF